MTDTLANDYPVVLDGIDQNRWVSEKLDPFFAIFTSLLTDMHLHVFFRYDCLSNRFEAELSEFGLDFNEDMNLGRTDDGKHFDSSLHEFMFWVSILIYSKPTGFLLGSTGPTDPLMLEKLILPSNFEG
jgi:hypothetical protein